MSNSETLTDWIGVDWGTSRMRVFAFDDADRLVGQSSDGPGMNSLAQAGFEPALLSQIAPFRQPGRTLSVVICGMVGSRQGWKEAPYLDLPVPLNSVADATCHVDTSDPLLKVHILPGLAQRNPQSPDVVRGEETQLLGLVCAQKVRDALVCLPGTHSKWLTVKDGQVIASRTFMTGELFDLIAHRSVLRHSVSDGFDKVAFIQGVRKAAAAPGDVLPELFRMRASDLLFGGDPIARISSLSGQLIGVELGTALPETQSSVVHVIGSQPLAERYQIAASELGRSVKVHNGDDMVIHGLTAACRAHRQEKQVAS